MPPTFKEVFVLRSVFLCLFFTAFTVFCAAYALTAPEREAFVENMPLADGVSYTGFVKNGTVCGAGEARFPTGERFEGVFSAGAFRETGVFYFAEGGRAECAFSAAGALESARFYDGEGRPYAAAPSE